MTGPDVTGPVPDGVPSDGHAGDLASAHLDGELDPVLATWVAGHLQGCNECRDAAEAVARSRELVRSLPPVPPAEVIERIVARRHALVRRSAVFVAAAGIVLAAMALSSAVRHRTVVPAVDEMVDLHRAADRGVLDGMEETDDAGRTYAAPTVLVHDEVRLSRRTVYDGPDVLAIVYDNGTGNDDPGDTAADDTPVSVFEQPGRLDRDALSNGEWGRVGGRTVWRRSGAPTVVVAEVGHLVVTVVSDDPVAADAVVEGLPRVERRSTWDRVHDACQRFTEVFALGG